MLDRIRLTDFKSFADERVALAPLTLLGAGQGRKCAMRDLGAQWRGVLAVCTELAGLQRRVADWHGGRA